MTHETQRDSTRIDQNGIDTDSYQQATDDNQSLSGDERSARDLLTEDDAQVLRRRGRDCTFYYTHRNGQFVERAVFDDGRIGGVYQTADLLKTIPADEVEPVPAAAWPTRDDTDADGRIAIADGGLLGRVRTAIGGDPDPTDTVPTPLDTETVLDLLKNERRRSVVRILSANETAWDVGDLAEVVAVETNGVESADDHLSATARKRVYVSLYQSHIPKLESAGVIETDGQGNTVWPGEGLAQLRATLDAVQSVGRDA